jgi:hypothetical protein
VPRRVTSPRRVVAECLLAGLVVGLLAGVAWYLLVPDVTVSVGDDGEPRLGTAAASGVFAYDAWFMVVGSITGLVLGAVLFTRHRRHPVVAVVAIAASGLVGSLLAWRVGVILGPEPVEARATALDNGGTLTLDVGLEAYGVLLAWPIAALVAVLAVSAWLDDRAPVSPRHAPPPPPGVGPVADEPAPSDVGPRPVS